MGKGNKRSAVCQADARRSGGLRRRKPGSQSALERGSLGRDSLQHADAPKFLKRPGISGSALVLVMQSKGPAAPAVLGGGSGSRAVSAAGWLLWISGRYGYLGIYSM